MEGLSKNNHKVLDIAYIAIFSAFLIIQEEALSFIPNVSLTFFLIVLYSKKLGLSKTTIILVIHVLLDSIIMGSFNIFFMIFMFLGYLIIPVVLHMFKNKDSSLFLAIIALLCSFLYSWIFVIPNYILYKIDVLAYLASDLIFEIILATCSFVTTILLYKPCSKLFDKFIPKS